jgi:4-hydroxyphenylacetate 3-monooxygenase
VAGEVLFPQRELGRPGPPAAGHRLTFQLFAQSPPFAHLAAVYNNFDFSQPLEFVQKAAQLSDKVMGENYEAKWSNA